MTKLQAAGIGFDVMGGGRIQVTARWDMWLLKANFTRVCLRPEALEASAMEVLILRGLIFVCPGVPGGRAAN